MAGLPAYPKQLVAKEWDKHKGLVAKMKGFTGIGDKLKELETGYKALEQAGDLDAIAKCKAYAAIEKLSGVERQIYDDLIAALDALVKLATDTAKAYRDSKVVGKTTREYVEDMVEPAKKLQTGLAKWHESEYRTAVAAKMNSVEIAGASLIETVRKLPGALMTTLTKNKELTDETAKVSLFTKLHKEFTRTLSGDLQNYVKASKNPTLSKFVAPWGKLGGSPPGNADEIREYVKTLMEEFEKLKKALIGEGVKI